MKTAVIIPWKDAGCPFRKRNLNFLLKQYSHFPVILGSGSSTGGSRNDGALRAIEERYDVLVFIDADMYVPKANILEAAKLAEETGRLVYCYDSLVRLTKGETSTLIYGSPVHENAGSRGEAGAMAISVDSFLKIKGWPEISMYEDALFWCQARAMLGSVLSVPGTAKHMFHPPSYDRYGDLSLVRAYERAESPEEMQYILKRSKIHARFGDRF